MNANATQTNIFEEATKQKLRFASDKGDLTVEQLWDLPLLTERAHKVDLDSVGRSISRRLREMDEDSLVESRPNPQKALLTLQLDVVKAIIARKQADNAARLAAADAQARRKAIVEALANRQQQDLEGKSEADLREELARLDAGINSQVGTPA